MLTPQEKIETRVTFEGSQVEGKKWLPFAFRQLERMMNLYKDFGQATTRPYKPNDGILILCSVKQGGYRHIHIKSEISCPIYKSGIIRKSYIKDGNLSEFYPSKAYLDSDRNWQQTNFLATPPNEYYGFSNVGNASEHQYIKASMYAGDMRKYMQILLAYRIETNLDYRWEKSHCLYFNTDPKVVNGKLTFPKLDQFWIVEIGRNGCYAKRAEVCQHALPTNPDLFPFVPKTSKFPIGDSLDNAVELKSVLKIFTTEEMSVFYGDSSPFFAECGWTAPFSTSYKGLKTIYFLNTCYRVVNGVLTSQVWRIDLSILELEGVVEPVITKNIYLVESGVIGSNVGNSGLHVPDYESRSIKTLDFSATNTGEFKFPWYVFHSQNDRLSSISVPNTIYAHSPELGNNDSVTSADLPFFINNHLTKSVDNFVNGNIFADYPEQWQSLSVFSVSLSERETSYVVPLYDRNALITSERNRRKDYSYNTETQEYNELTDSGNSFATKLMKQDYSNLLDLIIAGNTAGSGYFIDNNFAVGQEYVQLVTDSFSPYTAQVPPVDIYRGLFRLVINNETYSFLNDYVNSSYSTFTDLGNQWYETVYPTTDDLTEFSFVGKP